MSRRPQILGFGLLAILGGSAARAADPPPPPSLNCAGSYTRSDVSLSWFDHGDGYWFDGMTDDGDPVAFALPFAFDFYGTRTNKIWVSDNGWASPVENLDPVWEHHPIPDVRPPLGLLAPFWTDLDPDGTVPDLRFVVLKTFGIAPNRVFTVTWDQFPRYDLPTTSYTFQIALYETTNVIRFQYADMIGEQMFETSQTIGIENVAGTAAVQHSFNDRLRLEFSAMEFRPARASLGGCASAPVLACGAPLTSQTMGAANNQTQYGCSDLLFLGSEKIYALDVTGVTHLDLQVTPDSPAEQLRLFLFPSCDPCSCLEGGSTRLRSVLGPGRYYVVVDGLNASDDGPFSLSASCTTLLGNPTGHVMNFGDASCGVSLDFDLYADGRGVWTSEGWFKFGSDRNYNTLRVDGWRVYSTNSDRSLCGGFDRFASFVDDNTDQAISYWRSPEAEIFQTVSGVRFTATPPDCCGVRSETRIRNIDTVAHNYEFRTLYSTDFGLGVNVCPDETVEGGPIHVDPAPFDYTNEQNLSCDPGATTPGICGVTCTTPIELKSSDDLLTKLIVQTLGPTTTDAVQGAWVDYYDVDRVCGTEPWMGGYGGLSEPLSGCAATAALLYSFRVPPGSTTTTCGGASDRCLSPGQDFTIVQLFGDACRLNPSCTACLATANLVAPDRSICLGRPTRFDASRTTGSNCPAPSLFVYRWFRDGVLIPTAVAPFLDVQEATTGDHTYTVTVSCEPPPNGLPCQDSRSATLSTYDCAACSIQASVTAPAGPFCLGQTVELSALSSAINNCPGTVTYAWTRNGVLLPGETVATLLVNESAAGTYNYGVRVTCAPPPTGLNCSGTSVDIPVTYDPGGGNPPSDRGNTLQLTKSGAGVALSWAPATDGVTESYDVLRGTTKQQLDLPGPAVLQGGILTPTFLDANAVTDTSPYFYRVRGFGCGQAGPF